MCPRGTFCARSTGSSNFTGCGRVGAVLQHHRAAFDPELMIRMLNRRLLLRQPLGAAVVRRSPPEHRVPLVSLGGVSTPFVQCGHQQVGAWRVSGFFACSTPIGVGGQDGLSRIGRPSFATRSADVSAVATSGADSSDPRTRPGAPFRCDGGTAEAIEVRCRLARDLPGKFAFKNHNQAPRRSAPSMTPCRCWPMPSHCHDGGRPPPY
jgi:hypothetical protein